MTVRWARVSNGMNVLEYTCFRCIRFLSRYARGIKYPIGYSSEDVAMVLWSYGDSDDYDVDDGKKYDNDCYVETFIVLSTYATVVIGFHGSTFMLTCVSYGLVALLLKHLCFPCA